MLSGLIEFAKLASLLLCMLSLYGVFRTLFLTIEAPHTILQPPEIFTNRLLQALLLISFSAGISLLGAIIFRESEPKPHPSLAHYSPASDLLLVHQHHAHPVLPRPLSRNPLHLHPQSHW